MKWILATVVVASAVAAPMAVMPAHAASPVPVVMGATWDGSAYSLQNIVDGFLGGSGLVNVATDYIGADAGDPDPWFWVDNQVSALLILEVAGNGSRNVLGWYKETGSAPVIDGVDDGIIFNGPQGSGATSLVVFSSPTTHFGFWMNPNGTLGAQNAPEPEKFFTNRFYNDIGASGIAAHAPVDGDVQALIFDVSQWRGPNHWLVCFEDLDSGPNPTPCCAETDNDFNDMVFEVTALGATPTQPLTFGALKAKYR